MVKLKIIKPIKFCGTDLKVGDVVELTAEASKIYIALGICEMLKPEAKKDGD